MDGVDKAKEIQIDICVSWFFNITEIIDQYNHKFLNELEILENRPPSSENVAHYIAHAIDGVPDTPGVRVCSVTAWESDDA